jgi:hypothetical protein
MATGLTRLGVQLVEQLLASAGALEVVVRKMILVRRR